MPECCKCARNINNKYPGIRCVKCSRLYHSACADAPADVRLLSDTSSLAWLCPSCRTRENVNMSAVLDDDAAATPSSMRELQKSIYSIKSELLSALDSRFDSVLKSINFCCDKITDFETNLKILNNKMKDFENIKAENLQLKSTVKDLHNRVNDLEQYSRINNVVIQNVPEKSNENINTIISNIGKCVNIDIRPTDIDAAHRVPQFNKNSTRPKNIIVKFVSRGLKDSLMTAVRSSNVTNKTIGFDGTEVKIYLNDHLTKTNTALFKMARDELRSKNYKYIWSKNNKILARKTDTSKTYTIYSEEDIKKLN